MSVRRLVVALGVLSVAASIDLGAESETRMQSGWRAGAEEETSSLSSETGTALLSLDAPRVLRA